MDRSVLLDLLRVLAISLVFLAHFSQLLDWPLEGFFGAKNVYYISLGGVGVSLFLILSGILSGLGGGVAINRYLAYVFKKCLRIYPLYWMSVLVSIIAFLLSSIILEGKFETLFPNGLAIDLFGSFTGFYSWLGLWGGPYNSPSWFIGLIMSMYALFPLIYFLLKKAPHVVIICLFCFSFIARVYVGRNGVPFVEQSFVEGVVSFFYRQYGFMPGRPGDWFPLCRVFEYSLGVYFALILPKRFWFYLSLPFKRWLFYLSDLAFPMFLIHYPLLFIVVLIRGWGAPIAIALALYFLVVCVISHYMAALDRRMPKRF